MKKKKQKQKNKNQINKKYVHIYTCKRLFSSISNLNTESFRIDLLKSNSRKWLIHGLKHRKENQSQSPKKPCILST